MNSTIRLNLKILMACTLIGLFLSCNKDDSCEPASLANAGSNQNVIGTSIVLAANNPESGTGSWSIVSGEGGNLADPLNPTSTFTGALGETYVLKWTITGCPVSEDEVTISFLCDPIHEANAGEDQNAIGTSTTLAANATTGSWTIISGSGGNISQPTNAASTFTGVLGSTYVLRWTVECPESEDEVTINFICNPADSANAGVDQNIAATSTTLAANTPALGAGTWTIVSGAGGSITTPSSATSTFTGNVGTTYVLRWTVTCPASQDDVEITFNDGNPKLLAVDKTSILNGEVITVTGINFSANYNGNSQINCLKVAEPLMNQEVYAYIISRTATQIKAIVGGTNGGATGVYALRYNHRTDGSMPATVYPSNLSVEIVAPSANQFYTSQTVTSTNVPKGTEASFGVKNGSLVAADYSIKLVTYDYTTGIGTEHNATVTGITAGGFGGSMDKLAFTVPANIPSGLYHIMVTYNGKTITGGWGQFVNTY